MRRYDIDLCFVANEAHSSGLVAIDAAQPGAKIAVAEVGIGQRALFGGVSGRQSKIPRRVVVQQKRRGEMKVSLGCPSPAGLEWSSLQKTMPREWRCHGAGRDETMRRDKTTSKHVPGRRAAGLCRNRFNREASARCCLSAGASQWHRVAPVLVDAV